MKKTTLMTILAAASLAVLPTLATADRGPGDRNYGDRSDRDRGPSVRATQLGEVDTHAADVEDFVPVAPAQRFDAIVVTAHEGVVPLDDIKIQYTDGRIYRPRAHGVLRPGERIVVNVPARALPIKMIVLDYAERDRRFRDHADARVEVVGLTEGRRGRSDRGPRFRIERDGRRADATPAPARFEWRGGISFRTQ